MMSRVLDVYHTLHEMPELGMEEVRTAAYLAQALQKAGYRTQEQIAGKTGVAGIYESGNPGPAVAIRADMDALGIIIDGKKTARHLCGHDGHCAMVLAAAEEALEKGWIQKGSLKILFQPAEELGTGALSLIEGHALDGIDYVFGAHVQPSANVPLGMITPAMYHAASCHLEVRFRGVPAHGSRPHLGINAIHAASAAIQAVNAIRMDPNESYSIKATRFLSDSGVTNAIPGDALVVWDIRAEHNPTMDQLKETAEKTIRLAAESSGAAVTMRYLDLVPAAEYTDTAIAVAAEAIKAAVGEDHLYAPIRLTGGEDFHQFIRHYPNIQAAYFGIGCGVTPGLHHPDMTFDTSYLEQGKQVYIEIIKKLLG